MHLFDKDGLKMPNHEKRIKEEKINELIFSSEKLIEQKQFQKARELLNFILTELDEKSTDAMNNIAAIEILEENYNQALEILNKIVKYDPDNEIALNNIFYVKSLVNDQEKKVFKRGTDSLLEKYDLPKNYQDLIGNGDFIKVGEDFLKHFIKIGNLKENYSVLDVGCGLGRMALPLSEYLNEEGKYTGFDIVKREIEWCKKIIEPRRKNFNFFHADVFNFHYNPTGKTRPCFYKFPLESNQFDFVILTSVFTHMLSFEVDNYLSEISRVLKPGKRCFITFFLINDESLQHISNGDSAVKFEFKINEFRLNDHKDPEAAVAFEESFIRELSEKKNLKVVDPIYYGQWCGRENFYDYQDIIIADKNS